MTQRNQSLDLLRGVAVLLVVLVHCAISATGNVPVLTAFAHEHGERGVQLFFIVSGYTMMLTFGAKVDTAATRSFYLRRAFRIVPLFWKNLGRVGAVLRAIRGASGSTDHEVSYAVHVFSCPILAATSSARPR